MKMNKLLDLLKDKTIKRLIIAILVILIVVIVVAVMAKSGKKEEPAPAPEPTNIEITDKIKEEITNKIHELKYMDFCEINPTMTNTYRYDCLYRNDKVLASELSDKYRLYTLVLGRNTTLGERNNYIVGTIRVGSFVFNNAQYFKIDEIKEEYLSIYGANANFNPTSINEITSFPWIKYDEESNRIYYQTTGQEVKRYANEIAEYISKIDSDLTNVYVYVNIGYVNTKDYKNMDVYIDRDRTKLGISIERQDYSRDTVINKDNYGTFKKYKYTFEREEETDNFVFKQVEKVEE
jgi:hypothetical protein